MGQSVWIIADELLKYPDIGLEWKEPGMALVPFSKKNFIPDESKELPPTRRGKRRGKLLN